MKYCSHSAKNLSFNLPEWKRFVLRRKVDLENSESKMATRLLSFWCRGCSAAVRVGLENRYFSFLIKFIKSLYLWNLMMSKEQCKDSLTFKVTVACQRNLYYLEVMQWMLHAVHSHSRMYVQTGFKKTTFEWSRFCRSNWFGKSQINRNIHLQFSKRPLSFLRMWKWVIRAISNVSQSQSVANAAFYSVQSFRPSQWIQGIIPSSSSPREGREAVTDFLQVLSRSEVVPRRQRTGRDVNRGKYMLDLSK